jgi:hypothetical protein
MQATPVVDPKHADFGAAALVAVTDDEHLVTRDQELVVPGATRIDARTERIRGRDVAAFPVPDGDGEQAPAA